MERVGKTREGVPCRWRTATPLLPLLWCYALAIIAAGSLPRLPSLWSAAALGGFLSIVCLVLPARARLAPLAIAIVAGSLWSLYHNHRALAERLPLAQHGADMVLPLRIVSLPDTRPGNSRYGNGEAGTDVRFAARVLTRAGDFRAPPAMADQLLYLTWYRAPDSAVRQLRAGSRWLVPLRLKRPRGSVNPHSFDYEGWLLRRGVYATGYVRPQDGEARLLGRNAGLPALRHWLRDRLLAASPPRPDLLSALLLGDRSGLSRSDKELLRDTGTAHLLAISGLHVGMVGGFCLLLGGLLARAAGALSGRAPLSIGTAAALAGTAVYTLLAGAPLSAQRALVMTWVLLLAWRWRRRISAGLAFALALAAVLTLQPLAFYGAGFWLSFVAVGALLLGFSHRLRLNTRETGEVDHSEPAGRRLWRWFCGLARSQWVICLALLLPSLFFFSGFSVSGMLLNLLAIPWMGLGILPALMVGAMLAGTAPGDWCLWLAGRQLQLLMQLLEQGQGMLAAWQPLGAPPGVTGLLLAGACLLLLLLPAGLPGRQLGWLFALPLSLPFWPGAATAPEVESLRVAVLDVGQGLAVTVRSPEQRLVYDAGPLSASGWSAGSQIVTPYLLGEGERRLDRLVLSHGDSDHAGGLRGLSESLEIGQLHAPGQLAGRLGGERCRAGPPRRVGDLRIQWLWPQSLRVSGEENDHSCVVLLQWRHVRILLAGDISRSVERELASRFAGMEPVDLLVAPHHGSRSSSSPALIDWAKPRRVVFSAGFRHHFGHPHGDVVARYRRSGAQLFNTAANGAVELVWRGSGAKPEIALAREAPRFWYADHKDENGDDRRLSRRGELW
ncbi:DNA internalization-related competence protein ComEC/Rec2 [Microbulbifer halophilus]|uniref:DNA internalization-related competence protein ComEC/Rec2 n=2 Tax=Microbulbifer halophilus TaxID=453963 RepID=A0ABW5EF71_9GAMM|nr:DNA internalization-related competence protein ComEC/Rec2 [Microbulbifer halophilus]MCW8126025.1 DNA internalization-related competence protein ComEC/Rec2 [Microbulbifer halophilus]